MQSTVLMIVGPPGLPTVNHKLPSLRSTIVGVIADSTAGFSPRSIEPDVIVELPDEVRERFRGPDLGPVTQNDYGSGFAHWARPYRGP